MKKIRSYIGLALLGGMLVILPFTIFAFVVRWLWNTIGNLIEPISSPLMVELSVPSILADALVLLSFLLICLIVGIIVRTAIGRWLHTTFDNVMTRLAPGYSTIREMINQLLGSSDNRLMGEVVLVHIFGENCPTTMTGIVTSGHENGWVTVYVPTAPVPTSGLTYHVPETAVEYLHGVTVEEAMRTIIACGAGTADMLKHNRDIEGEYSDSPEQTEEHDGQPKED